jgi:hypothetical protein
VGLKTTTKRRSLHPMPLRHRNSTNNNPHRNSTNNPWHNNRKQ